MTNLEPIHPAFAETIEAEATMPASDRTELDQIGRSVLGSQTRLIVTLVKWMLKNDKSFRDLLISLVPVRTVYVADASRIGFTVAERRPRSLRMFAIVGMLVGLLAAVLLLWNGFNAGTINISDTTSSTQHALSSLVDTSWFATVLILAFTILGGCGGIVVGVFFRDPMTKLEGRMTYRDNDNVYQPVHVKYETSN